MRKVRVARRAAKVLSAVCTCRPIRDIWGRSRKDNGESFADASAQCSTALIYRYTPTLLQLAFLDARAALNYFFTLDSLSSVF